MGNKITSDIAQLNGTTLKATAASVRGDMRVVIGDEKSEKIENRVKIEAWGNDNILGGNFSFGYAEEEKDKSKSPVISTSADRFSFKKKDYEVHIYPRENESVKIGKYFNAHRMFTEGAMEYELVLNKKPKTYRVPFSIRTKNYDFFIQPTYDHAYKLAHPGTNPLIEGSIAVYHKTMTGDCSAVSDVHRNYLSGKAGHILAPTVTSANGITIIGWWELDLGNEIMYACFPTEFFDRAEYPVVVGPTFGYTTVGANLTGYSNGAISFSIYASPSGASGATSISASLQNNSTKYDDEIKLGIWSGSYSSGYALLSNGIPPAISLPKNTALGWKTATYISAPSISGSTNYCLGVVFNASFATLSYDTGGGSNTSFPNASQTGTYGTPGNISTKASETNRYSIYVTYGAVAASSIHLITRKPFKHMIIR